MNDKNQLLNECTLLLQERTIEELIQIKNFIELQRENDRYKYIKLMIGSWDNWKQEIYQKLLEKNNIKTKFDKE